MEIFARQKDLRGALKPLNTLEKGLSKAMKEPMTVEVMI